MSDLLGGVDPNEDFSGAMAALLASREETPSEEPAATEESAPQGQPRDDVGRYAPAAQSPEVPAEGAASPAAQEETPTDPEVAALLARHDGNVEAALKEAAGAQSLIGRQGNELGELRTRLEQLESRSEAPAVEQDIPIPGQESPEREALENFVAEHGGSAAMAWVAQNKPHLIDATLELWADEDPVEAAKFAGRMAVYEAQAESQQNATPASDPEAEVQSGLKSALETVQAERSDWEAIKPHLAAVLDDPNVPDLFKEAVVSQDPKEQLKGVRAVATLARERALAAATAEATQGASETATAAKQGAWVASGSLRPASEGQPVQQDAKEEATAAFQQRILKAGFPTVLDSIDRGGGSE